MSSVLNFFGGSNPDLAGFTDHPAAAEATPTHASEVLAEINQTLKMASIGVQLAFDKAADTMIASVVNLETGKVILQMSSEQLLPISKALVKLQNILVYQKICHEAQLKANSTEPASERWSRPWVTEVAADQETRAFKSVNA